ncbi:digestive organ expansion factor [Thraustotheca clavata]|uniref:Digestive organ expansion factor n=1 Tax=Thraustotheca clavata TaxID=74557 RepID=A0A1V9ZHV5_9STRA|nr:digestive organ expansion factor [Thraustotheca clavata]
MAKGAKKKGGKRKRQAWDDEEKKSQRDVDATSEKPVKKQYDSMFSQWKKSNVNRREQQKKKTLNYEQLKQKQFEELLQSKNVPSESEEEEAQEGTESEESRESDEEIQENEPKKKKTSTFQSFVSMFQAAPIAVCESDEKQEEMVYNEDVEDEDNENSHSEAIDEENEAENNENNEEDNGDAEEAEENDTQVNQDDEEKDPYRQRYLLKEPTEADFKELSTAKALQFKKLSSVDSLECHVRRNYYEKTASYSPSPLNHVRARLYASWKQKNLLELNPLQEKLQGALGSYQDLMFCHQTAENLPEIRRVVMMHVVNHVIKSRDTIARNTERLSKNPSAEYRDQGYCRPTILILAPLRSAAYRLVQQLYELLPDTITNVLNKDRFEQDFGVEEPSTLEGSEWQKIFQDGNNDDAFQIGIAFSRKSMRLYAEYHHADIIIASPLTLRQNIGDVIVDIVPGDKTSQKLPVDFLSSIEVCVLDSASVFLMQNMEHVRAVMNAINVIPKEAPNADFSRIREWNLNHQAHFFRQTIVYSHAPDAQLNNLLNRSCHNFAGAVRLMPHYDLEGQYSPAMCNIVHSIKQIFQRIDTPAQAGSCLLAKESDIRFEYFKKHIVQPLLDHPTKHTMIFVPSYFDFVRVRNLFAEHKKLINVVAISEYSTDSQISRARTHFFHGRINVFLVSERFHFYKQYRIRGVHQIFWYSPPSLGPFYSEVLNAMGTNDESEAESLKSVMVKYVEMALAHLSGKTRKTMIHEPDPRQSWVSCWNSIPLSVVRHQCHFSMQTARTAPSPVLEYDYPADLLHPPQRSRPVYERIFQYYTQPVTRLSLNDEDLEKPATVLPFVALITSVILGFVLSYAIDVALPEPPDFTNRTLKDFQALLDFSTQRANIVQWLNIPGALFVRALNCLVVPLIFVNLAMGVADLVQASKMGRITGRMFLLFVLTTFMASAQGLLWLSLSPEKWLWTHQTNTAKPDSYTRNRTVPVSLLCPSNNTYLYYNESSNDFTCSSDDSQRYQLTDTQKILQTLFSYRQSSQRQSVQEQIFNTAHLMVTSNLFGAFVDSNVLGIVAFAIPFGLAISRSGSSTGHNPMWALCQQLNGIFLIMITWVVQLLPFVVIFMIASPMIYPEDSSTSIFGWNLATGRGKLRGNASTYPFEQILARSEYFFNNLAAEATSLFTFLGLYVAGWIGHFMILLPLLTIAMTKHSPYPYLKLLLPAFWFGFFSSSTLAAMPLLMKVMHLSQYVSRQVTRFVIPIGTGVHMDGPALYISSAMIYLLRTQSFDRSAVVPAEFILDSGKYALIWFCTTLTVWTLPPLPHQGLVGLSMVWFAVVGTTRPTNLHWVIAMDVVLDRFSAVGSMVSNAIVTFIIAEKVNERHADEQDRERMVTSRHEWLSE